MRGRRGYCPQQQVKLQSPGNKAEWTEHCLFATCPPQSPEDDDRKVRRREKNRVAAQRSRKKQTQKADKLHEVRL